jgi:hypothetical protein
MLRDSNQTVSRNLIPRKPGLPEPMKRNVTSPASICRNIRNLVSVSRARARGFFFSSASMYPPSKSISGHTGGSGCSGPLALLGLEVPDEVPEVPARFRCDIIAKQNVWKRFIRRTQGGK